MRGSVTLAKVAGIRIGMHWTFLLLVAWVVYIYWHEGQTAGAAVRGVLFLGALFACVVLHELGHALTAKRFGINTRDITLLPIGGVARLERMPEDPTQELVVAIMGPVVTAVIAAILLVIVLMTGGRQQVFSIDMINGNFWAQLMWVNAFLLGFNLLPAFPMDGGRVLRALLHYEMDYAKATRIAATVGQVMAFAFGILGLFTANIILVVIAVFVYMGAAAEAHVAQTKTFTHHVPVHDVMVTQFRALSPQSTLDQAVEALLVGEQQDFPVVDDGSVVGVLTRNDLLKALEVGQRTAAVREVMRRECEPVEETEMLETVFERMRSGTCPMLPVTRQGKLVGMITLENVGEWIMIQSALQHARARRDVPNIYRPG